MSSLLQMGFYCGLSIMYPYQPVFCPTDTCLGDCRGVYMYTPKSAPLPEGNKFCEWSDLDAGMAGNQRSWYQWKPRELPDERQKTLSTKMICVLGDRGEPKTINELER